MKINKRDFTHYAWFRGVPCYWNDNDSTLAGRNWLCDFLLEHVAMPVDTLVHYCCCAVSSDYEPGFAIRLTGYITPAREGGKG